MFIHLSDTHHAKNPKTVRKCQNCGENNSQFTLSTKLFELRFAIDAIIFTTTSASAQVKICIRLLLIGPVDQVPEKYSQRQKSIFRLLVRYLFSPKTNLFALLSTYHFRDIKMQKNKNASEQKRRINATCNALTKLSDKK